MKPLIHKGLSETRWFSFSISEQLGNVGSEFERAASAFQRGDEARFEKAFERMLELLDLTIADPKSRTPCRMRELLRLPRQQSLRNAHRRFEEILSVLRNRRKGRPLNQTIPPSPRRNRGTPSPQHIAITDLGAASSLCVFAAPPSFKPRRCTTNIRRKYLRKQVDPAISWMVLS